MYANIETESRPAESLELPYHPKNVVKAAKDAKKLVP